MTVDLMDYAARLAPYYPLLAQPSEAAPKYVQRQWERWRWDAERSILSGADVGAILRPHCLRRMKCMLWVLASLEHDRRKYARESG